MITIKEAEEILKKEYHIDNFIYVVQDILLPDFVPDKHEVLFNNNIFNKVTLLGESKKCELNVYEVILNEGTQNRRVAITQEMFRILRGQGINNALVAFANADMKNYRLSLLTSKYEFDGDKVVKVLSNPRRYSYALGFGTKTKTAFQFLIAKGKVNSLEELIGRFSVEVVNKQFYNEIALAFTKLIGGQRDGKDFERELSLYGVTSANKYAEFAVRLIGRIIFCWFLKEKKSANGVSLVPNEILSLNGIHASNNYYHDVLEPLFFELLNTNQRRRKGKFATEKIYNQIPYLNGGLFSPHNDDQYKYSPATQTGQYGQVTIPNEWFVDFYNILGEYNFTVDENTAYDIELSIDPEMLGRIFENLLAEINPETGENAKKSTGSFYTPRDIVDYMVDNSILEYLKAKTSIDEVKLKALISYSKDDDHLAVFDNQEKTKIINALYTMTVLDPACGSGAFPIGMLQKIVYISQEIDPDAKLWLQKSIPSADILWRKEIEEKITVGDLNYIRKLNIIQHSIFGVDIQPIAVEIARLRCFLSLVIEETVNDEKPNRGINPLPNLDFKFIVANTLKALPHDSDIKKDIHVDQMSIFENQDHIDQLKEVREEYFSANNAETKTELKLAFSDIQKAMFQEALNNNKIASALYQALFQWEPFGNNSTNWFDSDWMFGIKEGFDIVIGNPPYIQLQKAISKTEKLGDLYVNSKFETFARMGDIYCLFYEKGWQLLKQDGILTFITSNKWMRAGYGQSLRNFLAEKTNPLILIDLGNGVFESATVDTNILIFKKAKNDKLTLACNVKESLRQNMSGYIQQNGIEIKFANDESWVILSSIEQSIKEKIERYGKPLKDWGLNIYRGVLTGFNDAFIITGAQKDELIAEDPKSAEIIRPILRGRDIKRYGYDFADLWLICTFPSRHYDIDDYPAVKNYLLSFGVERLEQTGKTHIINGEKVSARKKTMNKWFETQDSIGYWDDFSKQKIVWKRIGSLLRFALDNNGSICLDSTCFAVGEDVDILVAFLNSQLGNYLFSNSPKTGTGDLLVSVQAIEPIKVPKFSLKDKEIIRHYCKVIIDRINNHADYSDIEKDLDDFIFDIYGFSNIETQFIKEYVNKNLRATAI